MPAPCACAPFRVQRRRRDRRRSRAAAAGQKLPKLRPLPLGAFRVAVPVLGLLASEKVKRALSNLELFLAYLDELQTFANTSTAALLEPAGIRVPRPSEYLDAVLSYYQQRRR